jgi:thymidylate kinase
MKLERSDRARLIAFEGPAGSGKTALQKTIYQLLLADGVKVGMIHEFSESPIGKLLQRNSCYGFPKPSWLRGLAESSTMLADKIFSLESAASQPDTIWISDRFLTSQFVLGIRELSDEREAELIRNMISLTVSWATSRFLADSFVIMLEAPLEVLRQRLQNRLGYPLTESQVSSLREEIRQYSSIEPDLEGWNVIRVNSVPSVESVGQQLVKTISSRWAQ